jgi:hypothetical protein
VVRRSQPRSCTSDAGLFESIEEMSVPGTACFRFSSRETGKVGSAPDHRSSPTKTMSCHEMTLAMRDRYHEMMNQVFDLSDCALSMAYRMSATCHTPVTRAALMVQLASAKVPHQSRSILPPDPTFNSAPRLSNRNSWCA